MKHTHHIIPKHMGGTDDPSNLVELTVEEHAEAHRKLWEQYGHWEDEIAWKGLSKCIGNDEIFYAIMKEAGRENSRKRILEGTHHFLDSQVQSRINKRRVQNGTHNFLGGGEVQKKKLLEGTHHFQSSEWQTKENLRRVSEGTHHFLGGKIQKDLVREGKHHFLTYYTCPHCNRSGKGPTFKRHHFDKCKNRIVERESVSFTHG